MIRPAQYAAAQIGTSHNRTRRAILLALLGLVRSPTMDRTMGVRRWVW